MKKSLFMIFAAMTALFMVSCEPESSTLPAVSFVSASPQAVDGKIILKADVTNYDGPEVSVPVVFGGTAVMDVDYTVSSESFIVGGSNPVLEITVTLTNEISVEEKTITATIVEPDGFNKGQYPMCQYTIGEFLGYVSFKSALADLTFTLEIAAQIYDKAGLLTQASQNVELELEVDTENSTAVEGTHFEFVDSEKKLVISEGKSEGTTSVRSLLYDPDHSTIVLTIKENDKFLIGQTAKLTVNILSPDWSQFSGEWVMNEVVTTAEVLDSYWYGSCTYNGLPEFNSADRVTIDFTDKKFIPSFESTLSNYFIGDSNIITHENYNLKTSDWTTEIEVRLIELDNINRYFSSSEFSEDKNALVGIRLITDDSGQELLDMYIIDHNSRTFMKELTEFEALYSDKPSARDYGSYLNYTFKRAE